MALRGQSRYAQALEEGEKDFAIERKSLAPDHPSRLVSRSYLALTHFLLDHYRQAREIVEEVDALQRKTGGDDAPARAGTLANLGSDLIEIPDLAGAEKTFAESMRIVEKKKYSCEFDATQTALRGLASVHVLRGKFDIADPELMEAQQNIDKRPNSDDVLNYYWRGEVARARHDFDAAVALDRRAMQVALNNYGEIGRYPALAHHYPGIALHDAGSIEETEKEFRGALAAFGYIENALILAASGEIEFFRAVAARIRRVIPRRQPDFETCRIDRDDPFARAIASVETHRSGVLVQVQVF